MGVVRGRIAPHWFLLGLGAAFAALVVMAALRPPGGPFAAPETRVTVVQSGLEHPWDIGFTADGRMVVTERPGRIRVFASADPGAELLQTILIPDVRAEGEAGAMGLAVDRAFERFPFVYVCVSVDADGADGQQPWHNVLLRYRFDAAGSLEPNGVFFDGPILAAIHHDGCAVEMDGSGAVWVTMGDGNTAHTGNLAQDPASLNGKVLRLDRDGTMRSGNPPLPGAGGGSAAVTMGHRNPQGLAIRERDGLIVVAEHGTDRDDEINVIRMGAKYGYACYTGAGNAVPGATGCPPADAFEAPAWTSGFRPSPSRGRSSWRATTGPTGTGI